MKYIVSNCPIANKSYLQVKSKVAEVNGVKDAQVDLVFDPPWDQTMMSEETLLELL